MTSIPICCVTGRIAGDGFACGDCDPCGAAHVVPDVVKRLLKERDEWADKYAGAMMELDELRPVGLWIGKSSPSWLWKVETTGGRGGG